MAFGVALICENCGTEWVKRYPAETRVTWDDTQSGIVARDTNCEVLGMHCDCCTTLHCPTCDLRQYVSIFDRGPDLTPDTPIEISEDGAMDNTAMDPQSMPSQDPVLESFYEDIQESGHDEELPNDERGCGHLKHNAAYVRCDVKPLSSEDGDIPRFVELDEPVEYRESADRGAIIPGWATFPGVEFGLAYQNEGHTTTPGGDLAAHLGRLQESLHFHGEHYGEIVPARAHDLLMSVGASNWPTPEEYIEECREMGLNLRVPCSTSRKPPVVNPLLTRCWIVHPNGAGEGRAGIIGYSVLTRTVYTTGEEATEDEPDIPRYAQDLADAGRLDLVTPGEPVPADDDDAEDDEGETERELDAAIEEFAESDD